MRDNVSLSVNRTKVVVGDIINIMSGMEIPADCLVVSSTHLIVDEALITESNDSVKKAVLRECLVKKEKIKMEMNSHSDLSRLPTPILFAGSNVLTGEGKILVLTVGKSTIMHEMKKDSEKEDFKKETPLQKKLKYLAHTLGKIALQTSLLILLVLLMRFIIERSQVPSWDNSKHWNQLFNCFLIGVCYFSFLLVLIFLLRLPFLWLEYQRDCHYQLLLQLLIQQRIW